MEVHLVVVCAFGAHAKGDVIAEPAAIAAVLAGEHAGCVARVMAGEG